MNLVIATMSMIFDSIKTRNLDQVFELNFSQYLQQYVNPNIERAEVNEGDYSMRIASGLNHPDYNAVVQTDLSGDFDKIFSGVDQFFTAKQLPYTWYLIPSTTPEGSEKQLQAKGLRKIGYDVILGVELDSIIRNISAPNSLFIEEVNSQEKMETWIELYCRSHNLQGEIMDQMKVIFSDVAFDNPDLPFKKYLGWLNGEPVTCSTLVTAAGIAVVYDESLIPRYRDFGIENAINITPLKKAREAGYKLGLLPTSIGNTKRFTSLGFTQLFNLQKMIKMMRRSRRGRRR